MSDSVLRFDVIALFPDVITTATAAGVIGRAIDAGILAVHAHQLRDATGGSPHAVDDHPYGGGPGMVMRAEPIYRAVESVAREVHGTRRILLTPQGRPFSQSTAERLSRLGSILLFCGRYEGVDERVRPLFDEEISIGDYVLSGGEIAALAIVDAVGRLVPGVLGSDESTARESFSEGLLEYPQYTRPEEFRGMRVPAVLLSGDHQKIERWRREKARERTRQRRPDLLERDGGNDTERG